MNMINVKIKQYSQIIDDLLNQRDLNFSDRLLKIIPKKPGIYRIFERENPETAIYIGESKNLQQRIVRSHLNGDRSRSTLRNKLIIGMNLLDEQEVSSYLLNNCSLHFITIEDKDLLAKVEHFAIAVLTPKWND